MLAVIGGGVSGSRHARQLLKAVRAGRLEGPVAVVDRDAGCAGFAELAGDPDTWLVASDWLAFLRAWLSASAAGDQVIPAPVAPHLLWEWLAAELGAQPAAPPRGWDLPYERPGAGLELYLSAAAWRCPAACVEPAHCPALHGPRDWDLAGLIEAGARTRGYRPAVFRLGQLANGVAGVAAAELLGARDALAAGRDGRGPALVATSSHCHAAVGALRFE